MTTIVVLDTGPLGIMVVSRGLRNIRAVVFGVLTDHHEMEDGEATVLIGKRANLVSLGSKLTEEALE